MLVLIVSLGPGWCGAALALPARCPPLHSRRDTERVEGLWCRRALEAMSRKAIQPLRLLSGLRPTDSATAFGRAEARVARHVTQGYAPGWYVTRSWRFLVLHTEGHHCIRDGLPPQRTSSPRDPGAFGRAEGPTKSARFVFYVYPGLRPRLVCCAPLPLLVLRAMLGIAFAARCGTGRGIVVSTRA